MQGRRRQQRMSDGAAGESAEGYLCRNSRQGRAQPLSGLSSGSGGGRGGLGAVDHRACSGEEPDGIFRAWVLLEYGLRPEGLGLQKLQRRVWVDGGESKDGRGAERDQSGPQCFSVARGQADSLPRLERPCYPRAEYSQLLPGGGREDGTEGCRLCCPAVHGSRDAALWWRTGPGKFRGGAGRYLNRSA